MFLSRLIVICMTVFFLSACEDCTFTSKNTNLLIVGFYNKNPREAVERSFDSVKTAARRHISDAKEKSFRGKSISLEMNPSADTSTFYFYRLRRVDTLTVKIRRQISIITPNCGRDERLYELEVKKCTFLRDSLAVPRTDLTVDRNPNIEIYFK